MEPYEKAERSRKSIIINNFLGGIAWGLGTTIGLAILLAIIGFAITKIDIVSVLSQAVSKGFEQALENKLNFR